MASALAARADPGRGLGNLTFSAVFASSVGRWSRLAVEEAASDVTSVLPSVGPVRLLYTVHGVTLAVEADGSLRELGAGHRTLDAFFMAITPRTAGFDTVDHDRLSNPAIFLGLALTWAGGGPFSTAGGVKVTTAALLLLLLLTRLRGHRHVSLAGGAFLLLASFVFLMPTTEVTATKSGGERSQFVRVVLEVQSAVRTVGLSINPTPQVSPPGRLLLSLVMPLARVGPLAVLGAIELRERARVACRCAHQEVPVGRGRLCEPRGSRAVDVRILSIGFGAFGPPSPGRCSRRVTR